MDDIKPEDKNMFILRIVMIRSKTCLYGMLAMALMSLSVSRGLSSEDVTLLFFGNPPNSKCKVPLKLQLGKAESMADVDGHVLTHESLVKCLRQMDANEDEIAIYIHLDDEGGGSDKLTVCQLASIVRRISKAAAEAGATKKLRLAVILPGANEEGKEKASGEKKK